jgi:EpsI family protein
VGGTVGVQRIWSGGVTLRLLTLLAMAAAALVGRAQLAPVVAAPSEGLDAIPMRLGNWHGRAATEFTPQVIAALGVTSHLNRRYVTADGRRANLYIGYYESQRRGAQIHSPLNCLPGAGWEPVWVEREPFAGGSVRHVLIRKGRQRLMVLYWYQTVGRLEGDEYRSRLYTAYDTVRYRRNDAAFVRIIVPVGSGPDAERIALRGAREFAAIVAPNVKRMLFPMTAGKRPAGSTTPRQARGANAAAVEPD